MKISSFEQKSEGNKNTKVKKNLIIKIIWAHLRFVRTWSNSQRNRWKAFSAKMQNACFVVPQTALYSLMIPRFTKVEYKYEAKCFFFRNIKIITKIYLSVKHGK